MATVATARGRTTVGFDDFYTAEFPRLVAIARALTGRDALAEELAQEAMLVVLRRWPEVATMADPSAWARRVVANRSVSTFRRMVAEVRSLNRVAAGAESTLTQLEPTDERVWVAVRRLPAKQAAAVVLRYVSDASTDDIAEILECEPATVRVLLLRARRQLAHALSENLDEEDP
jgi:RNA polymerase sigma-70 factor (ECF subfamily)